MNKIIEIYEGNEFSIEFIVGFPYRRCSFGKHWPKTTQCIIKCNNLVIGTGEAVKHIKDKDDPKYGKIYSAKKAFINTGFKTCPELRKRLWEQILK